MPDRGLRRIRVFDTTLRDGDQTAGFAFSSASQKESLADLIDSYGVDCIEAGFPCASPMEFESCSRIAANHLHAEIAVMTRCREADIDKTAAVFRGMKEPKSVLHLSLPVSSVQMEYKLELEPAAMQALMIKCIRRATGYVQTVEMGFEDASRADPEFLSECCRLAIQSGARIINIADTTGSLLPDQTAALVRFLSDAAPEFSSGAAVLSVHCHNDMGLALASALAAVEAGAGQLEVTAAGIGERCGNVPLEQLAYVLDEYSGRFGIRTNLRPERTAAVCRTLFTFLGTGLSPFRPVTGWNTDSHASGMHQQGIRANADTYIVHTAEKYGMVHRRFILSRHSGTSGLRTVAEQLFSACPGLQRFLTSRTAAAALLESVKSAGADCSAVGITELCKILYAQQLLVKPPYGCSGLSVENSFAGRTRTAVVHIEITDGTENCRIFDRSGTSAEECCRQIAVSILDKPLDVKTVSWSGYRAAEISSSEKVCVYMEIQTSAHAYAVSRNGTFRELVYFECLLDVVNAELSSAASS
jgi:2-isopropylmalate synthase